MIDFLMKWCERRGKVVNITGTAGDGDTYMIRYIVLKNRFCNIYIHQFLRSDRDDLHDHPWHFMTYLVRGAYKEWKYNKKTGRDDITFRSVKYNRLVFRKATDQHRVEVYHDLKQHEKDKAALTLFISGPILREWGFIKEVNRGPLRYRSWIHWRKYLGVN